MPNFALIKDGAFTGRIAAFNSAPTPNPVKGFRWLPYSESDDPSFDEKTEKLSDEKSITVSETEVIAARSVQALSETEKATNIAAARQEAYVEKTKALKSVHADTLSTLGFFIDAIIGEIEAQHSEIKTEELKTLIAMRSAIKDENPK